ncbi:hypothetical protein P3W45_000333 [Vairimorpha bombi]|jgi:hypothetical protein
MKEGIENFIDASEKIDKLIKKIYKSVELTQMNATEEFKPFNEPKKNLDDLSKFYDTFINSDNEVSKIKDHLINIELESVDQIFEHDIINNCLRLYKIKEDLNDYEKVRIVQTLMSDTNNLLDSCIHSIENIYFKNLLSKGCDTKKLKEISTFLLSYTNPKSFLSKYSSEIYNKKSFDDIKTDKSLLIDRTRNLDKYFYDLNEFNLVVLGDKIGNNINIGLNKILIINLNKLISDNILIIEKDEKLEHVPFLINLNTNLRHGDEKVVREIEALFVFKDEINKLICNIFLSFVDNIDRMDTPNKYCDVESIVLNLKRALDSMNNNKIVSKVFIKNYGPFFKVKSLEEACLNFSYLLIDKIVSISRTLPVLKKNIYLINNFYTLQHYIGKFEDKNVKSHIDENVSSIINTFKNELGKRSGDKFTNFIDSNVSSLRSYYLPDEVRIHTVSVIKKAIWEEIAKKGYTGNENNLNSLINEMFVGK